MTTRRSLDDADIAALFSLQCRVEQCEAGTELVRQGEAIGQCIFLIDGFVSRARVLPNNQRHIFALCLPGETVDLQALFFKRADHTLETHAPSTVAIVSRGEMVRLMRERPNIMPALWLENLTESAFHREWIVNLGSRPARKRLAHLFLELEARYRVPAGQPFLLPVKQTLLASAAGLSLVHFNKSLQWLRREGFLVIRSRMYAIAKHQELAAFCAFNPAYLSDKAGSGVDESLRPTLPICPEPIAVPQAISSMMRDGEGPGGSPSPPCATHGELNSLKMESSGMAINRAQGTVVDQLREALLQPVSPRKNGRSAEAAARQQDAVAEETRLVARPVRALDLVILAKAMSERQKPTLSKLRPSDLR